MEEKKARYKDWRLLLAGLLLAGLLLGGGYLWGTLTHRPASATELVGTVTSIKEIPTPSHPVVVQIPSYIFVDVTFDNGFPTGEEMFIDARDASRLVVGGLYDLKLKATNESGAFPVWRIVGLSHP
jgi:hypothetical protein